MQKSGKFRKFITVAFAAAAILAFSACAASNPSNSASPSASGSAQASPSFAYDKDAAIKQAEAVIDAVNKRDYTAVSNLFRDDLKSQASADNLKKSLDPVLDKVGAFQEYKDAQTAGTTQKNVNYIVAAIQAQYEKGALVYTISFDTDMKLIGLYAR